MINFVYGGGSAKALQTYAYLSFNITGKIDTVYLYRLVRAIYSVEPKTAKINCRADTTQ